MSYGHAERLLPRRRPDSWFGPPEDGHLYQTIISAGQRAGSGGDGREDWLPDEVRQYPGKRPELTWEDVDVRTVYVEWTEYVIGVLMPDGRQVQRMSGHEEPLPPELAGYAILRGYATLREAG